ncbi:MAG: glycine betaine/L-proline ABC transporter ATP-binding protein [Parvibaculaceae bacterium]
MQRSNDAGKPPAELRSAEFPAISCEGCWKVFGAGATEKLALALEQSDGAPGPAATLLRQQDLIPAVRGVTFEVRTGELFVIMGLSGSGKSTLIRCLTRLIDGTAGKVKIEGEDIFAASKKRLTQLRRGKLGMVFQHFGLFPHMTAVENVAFPLRMQGQGAKARRARALEMLRMVGLSGREDSFPRQLSGGQRQRVGIARSLAADPDIWFLDEPFSALDPLIRRQLQDEFLKLQKSLHKTSIFITHDITEALKLADRIAIMRDGAIVQIGTPDEIVLNPVDDYVREFSRDVPKGRHAHVDALMQPPGASADMPDDPGLSVDMTINAALASCMALYKPVPVWGKDGEMAGTVHPSALAEALQVDDA